MDDERTSSDTIQFVPGKTDEQAAEDYREKVAAALAPVLAILNEASRKRNFQVDFQIGIDPTGRRMITALTVMKRL